MIKYLFVISHFNLCEPITSNANILFISGHLNENNLYKPPEAGRKSWETAKLPAIKLKNAVQVLITAMMLYYFSNSSKYII